MKNKLNFVMQNKVVTMKNIALIIFCLHTSTLLARRGWGRGPWSGSSDTGFLVLVMILGIPLILLITYLNYSSDKELENNKSLFARNHLNIDDFITGCLIYQCSKGIRNNVYIQCNVSGSSLIMTVLCIDDNNHLEYFNEFIFMYQYFEADSCTQITGEEKLIDSYKYEKHIIIVNGKEEHKFLFRVNRRHVDNSSSSDFIKYMRSKYLNCEI